MAKRAPALRVLLHGAHVADLVMGSDLTLQYQSQVVDELGQGALCLSVALPVQQRRYKGVAVERWCEGLLPEGETRTVLEQRFQVRRGDTFGLLAALGRDCAGAVAFFPEDGSAEEDEPATLPVMTVEDLAEAVAALPYRPLGVDDEVRASLGGLQAKLLLTRAGEGWSRPSAGMPSTHLLKPDPLNLSRPGLVVAEALVLRAAQHAGVTAAEAEVVEIGERRAIIVTRYDRIIIDGKPRRLHQEDGCQALGISPTGISKYQSLDPSSPSFAKLAQVLKDHAADPDAQLRRLGEAMTVNVAVGNTDGHARNHSLLLAEGAVQMAPLYDVAPTFLFVAAQQLGLWVSDQSYYRHVTRGHLIAEMTGWGLPEQQATEVVERTLASLEPGLARASAELAAVMDADVLDRTLEHLVALTRSSAARPAA